MKSLCAAIVRAAGKHWFLGGEDGPGRGERTRVSDPWAQSTWVFAALRLIGQPLAAAQLVFSDAATRSRIEDAALADFWAAPARGVHEAVSLPGLVEGIVALRGVAGGCFLILDDSWMLRTAALRSPVILAAPQHMTPLWEGRTLAGWAYRDGAGRQVALAPSQAIHLRMPNPGDPDSLDGVAPWKPARDAAEASRAGSKFARRIMDQNGDRGNFLIAKHALTEAQKEMLRAELREKRRAADAGEYRDSVIGGDVEIVPNPVSSVTAAFAGQMSASRDEIFVAYGVPPSMATAAASYSVGAASDWYRLICGTCASEGREIAAAFARVSEYVLGWRSLAAEVAGREDRGRGRQRRLAAEFDFSDHPVMAEVRAGRVEQLGSLFRIGVPVAAGNEFLRLGLPEYKGWGERYLPASMIPVESGDAGAKTGGPAPVPDGVEEMVRGWARARLARIEGEAKKAESMRAERWRRVDAARSRDRERVKKIVRRHLMAARAETLANLKTQFGSKALVSEYQIRAGVIEIVFDLGRWFDGLWGDLARTLGGIFASASEDAAAEAGEVLGESGEPGGDFDPLTEADPRVVDQLNRRKNLIKGASDEMHAELIASLEEGIEAGETLDQLTARVREIFKGFDKVRAETIARTETGAAYETARFLTFKESGITQKGWLSGGDDGHTRATHMAADGQVRPIDDFFEVGEARLLHPHDQVGGERHPGELINCRCVLTAEG